MLTKRQKSILYFIVDDFLVDSYPVSSKYLIDKYRLNVSSATVRNEMVVLEKNGYIKKAHTSSGRIPSKKGLKHYINDLTREIDMPKESNIQIDESLSNIEVLGQTIAHAFSEKTKHLTYVSLKEGMAIVKGVYLTPISDHLVLIILVTDSELIRRFTVDKDSNVSENDMNEIGMKLNQLLKDRPIVDVLDILKTEYQLDDLSIKKFIRRLVSVIESNIESSNRIVAYSGLQFLLKDFESEINTLETLYDDIENHRLPLVKCNNQPLSVLFGDELNKNYDSLSIISTDIKQNGFDGQLMVIGPQMMKYKNVIKAVNAFRN